MKAEQMKEETMNYLKVVKRQWKKAERKEDHPKKNDGSVAKTLEKPKDFELKEIVVRKNEKLMEIGEPSFTKTMEPVQQMEIGENRTIGGDGHGKLNSGDVINASKNLVEDGEIDALHVGSPKRNGVVNKQAGSDEGAKERPRWGDEIEQDKIRVDTRSVSAVGEED